MGISRAPGVKTLKDGLCVEKLWILAVKVDCSWRGGEEIPLKKRQPTPETSPHPQAIDQSLLQQRLILYLCQFGVWIAGLFIPTPVQQLRIVLYLPIKTVLFYRKVGGIQFYPDIGPVPADSYWHWKM